MMRRARILLSVADMAEMQTAAAVLEAVPHVVRTCSPAEAASQVESFRPDLLVTSVSRQELTAFSRVLQLVQASYRPLVLCLTAPGLSPTAVLEAGGDACLQRPFEAQDLDVHVRALLRRVPWLANAVHQVGRLVVDESSHVVLYDDEPLTLTAKEFGILVTLARDAGRVVSKRTLLERLWGFDAFDENLVEAHVSGLRRRLPAEASAMVQTVRGVGYVLRTAVPQVTRV